MGAHMKIVMVMIALGFALSGCASIVRGTSQTIAITSPPTTGANCQLTSAQGNWSVMTPGTVTVQRSKENVTIRCTKAGWQEGFSSIPSNFEGWTVGNIIFGGVIGVGVDAATDPLN